MTDYNVYSIELFNGELRTGMLAADAEDPIEDYLVIAHVKHLRFEGIVQVDDSAYPLPEYMEGN